MSRETASVSLLATRIATTGHGIATVKLSCTGTGTCVGKLTLTAKVKRNGRARRSKTETIGTATFTIRDGAKSSVKLMLNTRGRTLLSAAHGSLKATLTILETSPVPAQAKSESVRLVKETRPRAR